MGSGTTGAVAKRLQREYIGIDINPCYLAKAKLRIASVEAKPSQGNAAEESPKRLREVG